MDPKPPPEETPQNQPENQENEYAKHAMVDHKSTRSAPCDDINIKESKTLENFRAKVLEFARKSRMSPEHISLIERSLPELFRDLHVPNHPPYAAMINKAITDLDEPGGSTEEAISLFIKKEQNDLPWAHATLLKHHLGKLCESGDIVVTGEKCYMLNNACGTYNPNQIKAFNPSQIVAFNPNQISASPIPSYSPYSSPSSDSSDSYSDYTPYAEKRKQKRTARGKKRRRGRKKHESEEEFDINEEHFEETEEEEESEEYEDESEEFHNTEEEVEVTEVENQFINYNRKHTHRTGAKKNKTGDKSEFREERLRVVSLKNQVIGMCNRETKPVRGRGRPPKCSKPKTYVDPKEVQVEMIETHSQVLKQKRGRGRPSKVKGFEKETRPEKTQELPWETHNQLRGVLNRPEEGTEECSPHEKIGTSTDIEPKEVHEEVTKAFNQATENLRGVQNRPEEGMKECSPPEKIGTSTDIEPKEVDEEVTKAFNQATEDLKRPGEKRGRGRPPRNLGNKTYIGQKEAQAEVIDAHNEMDCVEKLKQKRRPGRPPKNSGGEVVVFEVQDPTTEDGMKLKQGRRRFRRKHEKKEVNKYLDQLESTVIQEMFERMKISCDDGECVHSPASPCFSCKACEPVMDDKMRKEREQKIQSSVGCVELLDKHEWTKLPEKSQELDKKEKSSWTLVQLPQEGKEDEAYPCQLHNKACRSETDEYTTTNAMSPAEVVHEEQQPGCIGQGGLPGYENLTTKATPSVPNYQHEDVQQQRIHIGEEQLLEIEEGTSTFMELLHSGNQYIFNDKLVVQPKSGMSSKPTYCTGGEDKNSECDK